MARSLLRPLALALGTVAACTTIAATVQGQSGSIDLKPYRMDAPQATGDDLTKLLDLRFGKARTAGPDLNKNREIFRRVAQSYVYRATFEQYYTPLDTGELKARSGESNFELVLNELGDRILVPTADTRFTLEQNEYIKEFGAAIDQAVVDVLRAKSPPPIIRVNAGRLLAVAARSGAPAHAKTIIALLTNKFYTTPDKKPAETPPEVLYYALKAAESLLAAYDPIGLARPDTAARHSVPERDLVDLVRVLEGMVLNGPPVADKAAVLNPDRVKPAPITPAATPPAEGPAAATPGATPATNAKLDATQTMTPDQASLVLHFRKQAVKALARVRFDVIGGKGDVPEVRPGFTLAKVAVSDASLTPPPATAEVGEAVIGLCGISPSPVLNLEAWGNAIANGTAAFVRPKTALATDKSVPWRVFGARFGVAFAGLKRNTQLNPRLRGQTAIAQLADLSAADIAVPLEKDNPDSGQTRLTVDKLLPWIEANAPKDPSFFTDGPQFKLNPRPLAR